MKVLHQVRTIRRIWLATPFLGVALFGIPNLLSLVYEEVFGLDSAGRGAIAAGVEPLQVIGVFVAMPRVAKIAMTDPGFLLRFVAIVGVVDGFVLVVLAYAPYVWIAIAMHAILAASIGTLAPAFFALDLDRGAAAGASGVVLHDLRVRHPRHRDVPARSSARCPTSSASRRAWSCWSRSR